MAESPVSRPEQSKSLELGAVSSTDVSRNAAGNGVHSSVLARDPANSLSLVYNVSATRSCTKVKFNIELFDNPLCNAIGTSV